MGQLAFRSAAFPVVIALLFSVCMHAVSFNPKPVRDGICCLDVCSKESGAVSSADFSITEDIFTVHMTLIVDASHNPPATLPESAVASPPDRPPAV